MNCYLSDWRKVNGGFQQVLVWGLFVGSALLTKTLECKLQFLNLQLSQMLDELSVVRRIMINCSKV